MVVVVTVMMVVVGGGVGDCDGDDSSSSSSSRNPVAFNLYRMEKMENKTSISTSQLQVTATSVLPPSGCTQNYLHKNCGRDLVYNFYVNNFLFMFLCSV